MIERNASAAWDGGLEDGNGSLELGSGAFSGPYSFQSRFGDEDRANPEELIGAAHAGCFSMALSMKLEAAGYTPDRIETDAVVRLDDERDNPRITGVKLTVEAAVPDIGEEEFQEIARDAETSCPVSVALSVPIEMDATLV